MRLIDQFRHANDPDTYTFVFDEIHATGEYTMLVMPETPRLALRPTSRLANTILTAPMST